MPEDELTAVTGTATLRALLETGEMSLVGRMPGASNATFLVEISGGGGCVRGVYKPTRGERPLWDFAPGLHLREAAAHELSEALGWGIVPVTVVREGTHGEGSVQEFLDIDHSWHYFPLLEARPDLHDQLRRVALFDIIANNADRKSGHVVLGPDGRVRGIDHGLCFAGDLKLRTVVWDFAGEPVGEADLADVAALAAEVPGSVTRFLDPRECSAMSERIGWILEHRVFPAPTDRRMYPWPLQ